MNFVLVVCTLACGHALFWAAVLYRLNSRLSNRLLSILLVMLALRVGKSVTGFVFPGHMELFSIIGLVSMAQIGPLALLCTISLFKNTFKMDWRHYLHFLPGLLSVVFALQGEWIVYRIFTAHVIVYLVISMIYLLHNRAVFERDEVKWKWIWFLLTGICLLWITFALQITFYHPLVYRLIVISAAVIFYALSWWAIPRSRLFMTDRRKPNDVPDEAHKEIGQKVIDLFEQEEVYTDPTLTVTRLAASLKVPAYVTSRAINAYLGKSFSELLVSYRIKKSERLLLSVDFRKYTIEAIAFESGFNTLSAFYAAFKKINKVTPAQFREQSLDDAEDRK